MNDYGAGEVMIEVLEKLYKKIPKRGLNNMTRQTYHLRRKNMDKPFDYRKVDKYEYEKILDSWFQSTSTIKQRMEKLCPTLGMFSDPYLPLPMMIMASLEAKEKARVLLKKIFDDLHSFTNKLDTVTVVEKDEIKEYKRRVQGLTRFLLKSGKILGMVLEAEFEVK